MKIEKLLTEAINEGKEEREIVSWHISKIGSCQRGAYLERTGEQPDKEFSDRELRIFAVGRYFEEWFISMIKQYDEFKGETQVRVEDKKLGISGYIDLLVTTKEGEKVYEIKTKHSRAFWYMLKDGKAMRQHEYQTWMYMYLRGVQEGTILYLSKDDLALQEYPVALDDTSIEKEVMEWVNSMQKAWEHQKPQLLELPDDKDWVAKYCRWHNKCKIL